MMTINDIKKNGLLIFEAILGSKAYGLQTANSDTDIRGVYVLPKDSFYGMSYLKQVSNETNDIVYYEVGRFLELLANNNPNILEMLNVPEECILYKHDIFDEIKSDLFLSKLCENSFVNYAYAQIKKAAGLEKKIMTPMSSEKKKPSAFCYVYQEGKSYTMQEFLSSNGLKEGHCGLTNIPHLRDCYALYHEEQKVYHGVFLKESSTDVCLSNVEKGKKPLAMLYFNKDGYSIYCKQYKEYWQWVDKRNEDRYKGTLSHGKKYDAKNMMHVFRLLSMAQEIAIEGKVNVIRKDREFLLKVKSGAFEYDELLKKANTLKDTLSELFEKSDLQEKPNEMRINDLLIFVRKTFYG